MKALFFDKQLEFREIPKPVPQSGEALIKIKLSAICNTDIEIIKGYMGFTGVPGHEFVGEVISPESSLFGKRVVGEINCPCHTCYLCHTGRPTHCGNRSVTGIFGRQGVFAGYICLPESNLHPVPDHVSDEVAVFTEPLAAAIEIFDQIHIPPSHPVFIFGAGKLGLLIAMVFRLNGCNYTLFDTNEAKISKARSLKLETESLDSLQITDKAEVCVDCTGNPDGFSLAMNHLFPRGILVLKTTVARPAAVDLNQIVIHEFRVQGSRCGPFAPAIKLLSDKLINPESLISHQFEFSNIINAFEVASSPDSLKVLIRHD